jgi:limonene-1,2-epoxide hydrolase
MTKTDLILRFVERMNALAWDDVYALMADDIVYHNVPFEPLHGIDAVRGFFAAVGTISDCAWETIAIAESGDDVLTERLDAFKLDGVPIALPVMGTFRVVDGKITHWRDYFDAGSFERQLGRPLG